MIAIETLHGFNKMKHQKGDINSNYGPIIYNHSNKKG